MAAPTKLYQDTLKLLKLYNQNSAFKQSFNQGILNRKRATYLGRPLKLYIWVISEIDRQYKKYYQQSITKETVEELLTEFWANNLSYSKLEQFSQNPTNFIPIKTQQEIEDLDSKPISVDKINQFEKFLAQKEREEQQSETINVPVKEVLETIEENIEEPIEKAGSKGQIAIRRASNKIGQRVGSLAKDAARGMLRGGGSLANKAGGLAAKGAARGLVALGGAAAGSIGGPIVIAILIVVVSMIVWPILSNFLQTSALCLPFQPNCNAVTKDSSLLAGGAINSCQFTRGDHSPTTESYQSPKILSYFQEAEEITTVPAVVLAAIARVESPSITQKTDSEVSRISSLAGCPRSPTGALGIMQVQPPGTRGYFKLGVERGAKFLYTTADKLTEEDFCDVKKSIIIASGFILEKIFYFGYSYGEKDNKKWNPVWTYDQDAIYKVAEGFYGCLAYGGGDPLRCSGPYSYGNDIWTSISSCKITPTASCPVANGKIKVPSIEKDTLNGHCGPAYGSCPANSRRAKSIDVDTQNQQLIFPTISGQKVNWTYLSQFPLNKAGDCEGGFSNCGVGMIFQANLGSDSWTMHLLHIDPATTKFRPAEFYQSGTVIGKTVSNLFLHVNMGVNISNPANPPVGSNDFDAGWIAADFMCNL